MAKRTCKIHARYWCRLSCTCWSRVLFIRASLLPATRGRRAVRVPALRRGPRAPGHSAASASVVVFGRTSRIPGTAQAGRLLDRQWQWQAPARATMDPQVQERIKNIQHEAYMRLLRVVCAQPYNWVRPRPNRPLPAPRSVSSGHLTEPWRPFQRTCCSQDTEELLTNTRKILNVSNEEHGRMTKDCRPGGRFALNVDMSQQQFRCVHASHPSGSLSARTRSMPNKAHACLHSPVPCRPDLAPMGSVRSSAAGGSFGMQPMVADGSAAMMAPGSFLDMPAQPQQAGQAPYGGPRPGSMSGQVRCSRGAVVCGSCPACSLRLGVGGHSCKHTAVACAHRPPRLRTLTSVTGGGAHIGVLVQGVWR